MVPKELKISAAHHKKQFGIIVFYFSGGVGMSG
jgi:hypothetical protein